METSYRHVIDAVIEVKDVPPYPYLPHKTKALAIGVATIGTNNIHHPKNGADNTHTTTEIHQQRQKSHENASETSLGARRITQSRKELESISKRPKNNTTKASTIATT